MSSIKCLAEDEREWKERERKKKREGVPMIERDHRI